MNKISSIAFNTQKKKLPKQFLHTRAELEHMAAAHRGFYNRHGTHPYPVESYRQENRQRTNSTQIDAHDRPHKYGVLVPPRAGRHHFPHQPQGAYRAGGEERRRQDHPAPSHRRRVPAYFRTHRQRRGHDHRLPAAGDAIPGQPHPPRRGDDRFSGI